MNAKSRAHLQKIFNPEKTFTIKPSTKPKYKPRIPRNQLLLEHLNQQAKSEKRLVQELDEIQH